MRALGRVCSGSSPLCQVRTTAGEMSRRDISPKAGRRKRSSWLRYSARVRVLMSRCSSQVSAYGANASVAWKRPFDRLRIVPKSRFARAISGHLRTHSDIAWA